MGCANGYTSKVLRTDVSIGQETEPNTTRQVKVFRRSRDVSATGSAWLVVQQECVEDGNRPGHKVPRFGKERKKRKKVKDEKTRNIICGEKGDIY